MEESSAPCGKLICYPRRTYEDIDGVVVPMIALQDLLVNKKASGRHKDLADVEEIEKRKK